MDYSKLEISTPCYIFLRDEFNRNITMFKDSLRRYFGDCFVLAYSFKTNYDSRVLNALRENGCFAEVVSDREYNLALECGFPVERIVYNGPCKTKESFEYALENASVLNIDSKQEIEWLKSYSFDNNVKVGIRVNFDLEQELPGHTLMGSERGRFGFCIENGELTKAVNEIKRLPNVEIVGLHMHVSSKSKSVQVYECLIEKACEIISREQINCEYIDIGGGFFGGGDDGSAYEKYVSAIFTSLKNNGLENITLIVEPGASVIASAVDYVTKVTDVKMIGDVRYLVADGSRIHVDPFMAREQNRCELPNTGGVYNGRQIVCGATCMEKDRLFRIDNEALLNVGDILVFHTVGSYTMSFNSEFIIGKPRVYSLSNGKLTE